MPTGIHEVRSKMEEVRGEVYNLQGQRLTRPQKGLIQILGGEWDKPQLPKKSNIRFILRQGATWK